MTRTPLTNEPPLLDPERALRLVEDARAIRKGPGDWQRADHDEIAASLLEDAALLALDVAIDTGDPRLLEAALELAEDADGGYWEDDFAGLAEQLVPHVAAITNAIRDCARSPSDSLRESTAKALGPRALRSMKGKGDEHDAEAAQIVFSLAKDEVGAVRKSARDALGGVAPPAWAALFPRDPLASRPAAEAAALRGPLDRAAELLDMQGMSDAEPLATAIAELPDDLAMPILDRFLRIPYGLHAKGAGALLERWVTGDADGARLFAWLEEIPEGNRDEDGERIGALLARRSDEERVALGMRLAPLLFRFGERVDRAERGSIYSLKAAEGALKGCWPDEADPTPLLELRLGAPLAEAGAPDPGPRRVDLGVHALERVALAPRASFEAIAEPLVDAFLAGFPGRWARIADSASSRLLEVSHPRLRAHAEAQLREGSADKEIGWALRYLVGGGHDPTIDPEPAALLATAARDPRLRAAMTEDHHLSEVARELLRAQLTEGALSPHEAIVLARSIAVASEEDLTEAEWAALAEAREQAALRDRAAAMYVLAYREEWSAADHAFAERLAGEHGGDEHVASLMSLGFYQRPAPERVPLLERLLAHRHDRETREEIRDAIEMCRDGRRPL